MERTWRINKYKHFRSFRSIWLLKWSKLIIPPSTSEFPLSALRKQQVANLWPFLLPVIWGQPCGVGLRVRGPWEASRHLSAMAPFRSSSLCLAGVAAHHTLLLPTPLPPRSGTCLLLHSVFLKENAWSFRDSHLIMLLSYLKLFSGFSCQCSPSWVIRYIETKLLKVF